MEKPKTFVCAGCGKSVLSPYHGGQNCYATPRGDLCVECWAKEGSASCPACGLVEWEIIDGEFYLGSALEHYRCEACMATWSRRYVLDEAFIGFAGSEIVSLESSGKLTKIGVNHWVSRTGHKVFFMGGLWRAERGKEVITGVLRELIAQLKPIQRRYRVVVRETRTYVATYTVWAASMEEAERNRGEWSDEDSEYISADSEKIESVEELPRKGGE